MMVQKLTVAAMVVGFAFITYRDGPKVQLVQSCPQGISAGVLMREKLGLGSPTGFVRGELKELGREHSRTAAPQVGFYSVNRRHAPEREWLRFAIDSAGMGYRISGFPTLDLEALACRMTVSRVTSPGDVWRALQAFAEVLAPFRGPTYLLGVSEEGVEDHPESWRLLGDSTDFPSPQIEWSEERRAYLGVVSVLWSYEARDHLVEWRFVVAQTGQILALNERLLAGQRGIRTLSFSRESLR